MGNRFLSVENPILDMGAAALVAAFKEKKLSPSEYAEALIARVAELDGELNSFLYFSPEAFLEDARKSEQRIMSGERTGALEGLPVSYKDLIYSKGIPTTCASEFLRDFVPDYDATLMERLKLAGSIMQGKVNTQFCALGSRGELGCFGRAKNPYDLNKITGGSSSGSAAAVAAFLSPASIGTDTGGSARIPPSLCGVVGMKPTFGRVSCHGVWPLSYHFDTPCPITRSVEDNALLLSELAGFDPLDPLTLDVGREDFRQGLKDGVAGLVIGVCEDFMSVNDTEETSAAFQRWLSLFEENGAKIVTFPFSAAQLQEFRDAHQLVEMGDAYTVHEEYMKRCPEAYPEPIFKRVQKGDRPCTLYGKAEYQIALSNRAIRQAMAEIDILISPTVPIPAADYDVLELPMGPTGELKSVQVALCDYTWLASATGMPAISVPGGATKEGLPIGAHLMGKDFSERALYRAAYLLEQAMAR